MVRKGRRGIGHQQVFGLVDEGHALFRIRLPELGVDGLIHGGVAISKEVEFGVGDEEVADRVVGIDIGPTAGQDGFISTGATAVTLHRGIRLLDLALDR